MTSDALRERFLGDVATHQMTVLRHDGLYRHLRFRRPGTSCMGFDVLTWPGYLVVAGDMGEYVFQRVEDMFEFFRRPDGNLVINPQYWAEKCQAADRRGKIDEFDPDAFRTRVLSWIADRDEDEHARAELVEEIKDDVFSRLGYGYEVALAALLEVKRDDEAVFQDFLEVSCRRYTAHFQWICYALVWAIQQYDRAFTTPTPHLDTPDA